MNWFYAAALMCAKCVAREDPWLAKVRDWDMKCQLLRMIEWDHKARHGRAYDVWFNGKYLNRWVDHDVREALDGCWSGFAVTETAAALLASFALFETLAARTAPVLGLTLPQASRVRAELDVILSHAPQRPGQDDRGEGYCLPHPRGADLGTELSTIRIDLAEPA